MKLVNLTPYPLRLSSGEVIQPSGIVAIAHEFSEYAGDGIFYDRAEIEWLPEPQAGTLYVVSNEVIRVALRHANINRIACRKDLVRHPEESDFIRDGSGRVLRIPDFVGTTIDDSEFQPKMWKCRPC